MIKNIITYHVAGKACGPAEPVTAGFRPLAVRIRKRRRVGHLDDVWHVACGAGIEDRDLHAGIPDDIEDFGKKIARIQRDCFAGLEIDLDVPLISGVNKNALQSRDIVISFSYVVPSPHVDPLHLRKHVAELLFHSTKSDLQRVRVLLAQSVEMNAVQKRESIGRHVTVPDFARDAQAAAPGARIVDLVALLRGAFRVDAKAHALAARLRLSAELPELAYRVKHDVVSVLKQLIKFVVAVRSAEDMHFA